MPIVSILGCRQQKLIWQFQEENRFIKWYLVTPPPPPQLPESLRVGGEAGSRLRFQEKWSNHTRIVLKMEPPLQLLRTQFRNHITSPAYTAVPSIRLLLCLELDLVPQCPIFMLLLGPIKEIHSLGRAWFLTLLTHSFPGQNPMWTCRMTELGHSAAS